MLFCHGFFGPAHQFGAEAGFAADEVSASLGIPTYPGDGPEKEAEDANYAAVLFLMLGWFLWLSSASSLRHRIRAEAPRTRVSTLSLAPGRRTMLLAPLLQVYRL